MTVIILFDFLIIERFVISHSEFELLNKLKHGMPTHEDSSVLSKIQTRVGLWNKTLTLSAPWRYTGGAEVQLRLFLSSALGRGEWLGSCPGRLTPWKYNRDPFNWRVCGLQSRSGRFLGRENLLLVLEFEPRTTLSRFQSSCKNEILGNKLCLCKTKGNWCMVQCNTGECHFYILGCYNCWGLSNLHSSTSKRKHNGKHK